MLSWICWVFENIFPITNSRDLTFAAHFCWAIMVIGPWEEWRVPPQLNRFAPHPYPRALCYACIARVLQNVSFFYITIHWGALCASCTPCYACMCTSSSVIPSHTTVYWGASLSVPLALPYYTCYLYVTLYHTIQVTRLCILPMQVV